MKNWSGEARFSSQLMFYKTGIKMLYEMFSSQRKLAYSEPEGRQVTAMYKGVIKIGPKSAENKIPQRRWMGESAGSGTDQKKEVKQ
jgi:hypothetical protein